MNTPIRNIIPAQSHRERLATILSSDGDSQIVLLPGETEFPEAVQQAVTQIRALRRYTAQTGFKTTRSENAILQKLNGEDLANALLLLDTK